MTDAPLRVDGLTIRYGSLMAVADISFQATAGAVTAILGPNGAGKTSTIEACTGLRAPSDGSIRLLGGSPSDAGVRARIGVMLQEGGLYPTARPLEWLRYLARLYPSAADPAALLADLGMDPATRTTTRRLSGGQAQRVKLAAALLPNPEVMFLDEPTAGLDPTGRRGLLDIVRQRRETGCAVVMSTHVLADVEELADQVIVIAEGRIVASGTIDELTGADEALRFEGPVHLPTASLAANLPADYRVAENAPGKYVVHGPPTPPVVSAVAAWCAQHGALASGLRPGRQSIEEIIVAASNGAASNGALTNGGDR